jgi:DNA-binding NarL/FixJ family response regulator
MKLLLVDDHPLFGVGFAHALTHARPGISVLTALGLDHGLAVATSHPDVDVVLIDYRLAGADDGLEGLRRFGSAHPLVARVLISGQEDATLSMRARAAGAAGFLGKSLTIEQLLAALDRVCQGGECFDAVTSVRNAAAVSPTARQLEVMGLLARGMPNKRIALELGIAERTVRFHVTTLFEMLDARNRTHLLVRAREKGLI